MSKFVMWELHAANFLTEQRNFLFVRTKRQWTGLDYFTLHKMITAAIINNNHSLSTQNATQTNSHHDGKDLLPGARSIEFFFDKHFWTDKGSAGKSTWIDIKMIHWPDNNSNCKDLFTMDDKYYSTEKVSVGKSTWIDFKILPRPDNKSNCKDLFSMNGLNVCIIAQV